jgi:hypothetical protein
MQTQHLIIIAAPSAIGVLLMAYFIRKLLLLAFERHYAAGARETALAHGSRIAALNADITELSQLRKRESEQLADLRKQMQGVRSTPFISTDYRDLMEITKFLALALHTWKALPGTDSTQARAEHLIKISKTLAYRVFHAVESAATRKGKPLDTLLIEWLNEHGTFSAEPEISTISFPHEAETEGYPHLRDALREAYELDQKRQAIELDQLPAENAA